MCHMTLIKRYEIVRNVERFILYIEKVRGFYLSVFCVVIATVWRFVSFYFDRVFLCSYLRVTPTLH